MEIRNIVKEELDKIEELLESATEIYQELEEIIDGNEKFIKDALVSRNVNSLADLKQGLNEIKAFVGNKNIRNLYMDILPTISYYNPELFEMKTEN